MKKSKATEALRVATDVAAIRTVLHQRGYQLRKQPKQPVWKVIITPIVAFEIVFDVTLDELETCLQKPQE
jgi:hypothetical protein